MNLYNSILSCFYPISSQDPSEGSSSPQDVKAEKFYDALEEFETTDKSWANYVSNKVGFLGKLKTTMYKFQVEPFVALRNGGQGQIVTNIIRAASIFLGGVALAAMPISWLFLAGAPIEMAILGGAFIVCSAVNAVAWRLQRSSN